MNLTINELCNQYFDYLEIKSKPQTLRTVKSRCKNYILSFFEQKKVSDITRLDILQWQQYILNKNFSFRYNRCLYSTLTSIFNFGCLFYDLEKNVAKEVGNFNNINDTSNSNIDFWTLEEYQKFSKVVDDQVYKVLFDFLYFTGCRIGEVLALNFKDFENETVLINKTITKEFYNGKRLITTPKTKKSIRKIKLDSYLCSQINGLREHYITTFQNYNDEFFIFGGNKPLAPTTITKKKNKYCKLANVKQIRIHDFRHSHATLLLHEQMPILAISTRLGHSNHATTLNTYSHVMKEDEIKVINTLNNLRIA